MSIRIYTYPTYSHPTRAKALKLYNIITYSRISFIVDWFRIYVIMYLHKEQRHTTRRSGHEKTDHPRDKEKYVGNRH